MAAIPSPPSSVSSTDAADWMAGEAGEFPISGYWTAANAIQHETDAAGTSTLAAARRPGAQKPRSPAPTCTTITAEWKAATGAKSIQRCSLPCEANAAGGYERPTYEHADSEYATTTTSYQTRPVSPIPATTPDSTAAPASTTNPTTHPSKHPPSPASSKT